MGTREFCVSYVPNDMANFKNLVVPEDEQPATKTDRAGECIMKVLPNRGG